VVALIRATIQPDRIGLKIRLAVVGHVDHDRTKEVLTQERFTRLDPAINRKFRALIPGGVVDPSTEFDHGDVEFKFGFSERRK
jgi:hypothetical protein